MENTSLSLEERLRKALITRQEIIFAYLFGSHARGTANKLSDVDVAVFLDELRLPPVGHFGYKSELLVVMRQKLREPLDFVILNEAPLPLRFRVLRDGKLLFCRDVRARITFHEKTMRDYLDFRPLQKIQEQVLYKRLAAGFGGLGDG
ncbi:MAG: nucleotidyltransferase domain-containing protein [Moorella humiferrea]|uniref:Nucleotidyltransferase domain protein n=1 Tax=Neomoorella humiferrea TaxID=676965 RepID=A0A2T0AVP7_9FIRM|nr:nucleotidyltransferase domain-containing protein [Moorella humiferrea]MBE3572939.1 nucleotidyltransferase domain-containing protein [Moorella humiferrea]PRR74774.1 Nucleotidyltransferase domain protein [Moorella humiferrea]